MPITAAQLISLPKKTEPILAVQGILGGVNPLVFNLRGFYNIRKLILVQSVTRAANATQSLQPPSFTDALSTLTLKATNAQRTRFVADLFGYNGLNALMDINLGGTVVYTQAGNATLSKVPVLLGSAADAAQRALVTANTACSAEFQLPISFVEDFRKEYLAGESLGFATTFDDGSYLKSTTFEVGTAPNVTTPAITINSINLFCEYNTYTPAKGSTVAIIKEYRQSVAYAGTGNVEVSQGILSLVAGDLARVSLLTTSDQISNVVVKLNGVVLRNVSFNANAQQLVAADFNPYALAANRFDIEFDINDYPGAGLPLKSTDILSIVATLATANDNPKNITVLSSYYGPLD